MIKIPEAISPIVKEYADSLGNAKYESECIGGVIMDWIEERHQLAPRGELLAAQNDYKWRDSEGGCGHIGLALMALGYKVPDRLVSLYYDQSTFYRQRQLKWERGNDTK